MAAGPTYRLTWRRPARTVGGREMLLRCSAMATGRREILDLLAGFAGSAYAGEYLITGPCGGSVYTDAALVRAWRGRQGTLPAASPLSLWRDEDRRRRWSAALAQRLRAAFVPAVGFGLVTDDYASSVVMSVERHALGGLEPL